MKVRKRNGKIVEYDGKKIISAINKAFKAAEVGDYQFEAEEMPNPFVKCATRELLEELKMKEKSIGLHHLGFARDLSSSTKEHIGSIYYLLASSVSIKEKDSFSFGRWVGYEEFKDKYYFKLESWSRAVFDYIYEDEYYSKLFGLAI